MSDTTKTRTRPATFTLEAMQQAIAEAVAEATARQQAHFEALMAAQQAKPQATNGASSISAKNDLQVLRACKRAGFNCAFQRIESTDFRRS
jgi:hypothetical protein